MTEKTCYKCHETKPASEFRKGRSMCKLCKAAYDREYRLTHSDKITTYQREYRLAHVDKMSAYNREYRLTYREERIAYRRERADEIAAYNREYKRTRIEETAAYNLAYYSTHAAERAVYYSSHADKLAAYGWKYHREHPERARASWNARRARMMGAAGWDYTTADMICARWEMWGNRCWICGEHEATATDHVKPIYRGGANWPCNLRPVCKRCNSRKGNKWPYPVATTARRIAEMAKASPF